MKTPREKAPMILRNGEWVDEAGKEPPKAPKKKRVVTDDMIAANRKNSTFSTGPKSVLDRRNIPKALQERDLPQWPRDPDECRARLQALVDRELPRLRALEKMLRVQYEEPAKAEAQVMALAAVTKEDMQLLRAERIHEQSFHQAATALLKVRKPTAASRMPLPREVETLLRARPIDPAPIGWS